MKSKLLFHLKELLCVLTFFLCLWTGNWLAESKPLWNDELYSQINVIDARSYKDILLIRFVEGNSSPLFYLIQKGIADTFHFKFPKKWNQEPTIKDLKSQRITRIGPNIFMSLSIALIFYFFLRHYSYGTGIYALLVTLSSYPVWYFWAEARPYALWFFLTTMQSLLFLSILKDEKINQKNWKILTTVHIALALTIIISAGQILIVSFLLWLWKEGNLKKYIFLTFTPIALFVFCQLSAHIGIFPYILVKPLQLIFSNVAQERILIFAVYLLCLLFYYFKKKMRPLEIDHALIKSPSAGYLSFMILMFLAAAALMVVFKIKESPGQTTFTVNFRYFLNLTPVGIIAAVLFSLELLKIFKKNLWMLLNISMLLTGALVLSFIRIYMDIFITWGLL